VAHAHEAVIAKRKGHWEILEHPEIKKLKAELQQRGDELEQRVAERTSELAQSIQQLKQEVNERKKAEEQIKRQIELTNEIIDTIPVMSWSILPDGKLEFVNKVWTNYTGLSMAEAIKDPVAVIHPDDLPGVTERWTLNRNAGRFHKMKCECVGLTEHTGGSWFVPSRCDIKMGTFINGMEYVLISRIVKTQRRESDRVRIYWLRPRK